MTLLIININIFHDLISVAIQMWVLMRYLPLMIGDKVSDNDPYWDNFLTLVTITDYLWHLSYHKMKQHIYVF